jgi:hypothetical protein
MTKLAGAKNISKTAGRLDRFEKTGQIDPGALQGGERWNMLSDRLRFSRAIGYASLGPISLGPFFPWMTGSRSSVSTPATRPRFP